MEIRQGMIFLVGVIVGVIIIIVALLIWYVRGAHLMTGILSDDEMMYEA